jgi:hypothetical protein
MFEKISTGWQFAKDSYSIIRWNKKLLVFPIISMIAALLVIASFALPIFSTGVYEQWTQTEEEGGVPIAAWVTLFCFYFCNYFVIVFFNAGLIACTMQALEGQPVELSYGFGVAMKRLPQIAGWALLSAIVGVLLNAIESNEKGGRFIRGLIGMAWTVMTYLAVPFIVLDGMGPIAAIKNSISTVRKTWGESLVGHFSLGLIGFLIALPVILLGIVLLWLTVQSGSTALIILAVAIIALGIFVASAASAAANMIFKALLYSYATGKSLPEDLNTADYSMAFVPKG